MDLKAKIDELKAKYASAELDKKIIHEEMKRTKRLIAKYESVLKHAEEIESVEEKPLV